MRIAYLTGRYPATSHTFIAREVAALRACGVEVETFSVWAADSRALISHQDREEAQRTWAILPLRPLRAVRAHARGFCTAPRAYVASLARAVSIGRPGVRGRLLGLSWHVEAVVLWDQLRSRDVRHVHVHLNGTAPSVALVLTSFANAADAAPARWSWSMTVHGPAEFYDVYGERLAEKVRSARAVVCISDFARSQVMALVDESEWNKLQVIHCGIDPDVFDFTRNGDEGSLQLLTIARLTQIKGLAILLQALQELRRRGVDAHLTIIGDGPKRSDLERLAHELGVTSLATFTGAVGQDNIRDYYKRADAFCLPSFAEGVPVVLMEAMAMRLPVVATDVMGVRELVEDGVNGVVVRPGRADLLADAIADLAADTSRGRRLGVAGRERVRREFNIRRSGEQLREVFEEILGAGFA